MTGDEATRIIRSVRFTPRIRGGYDMGEVDEFLDLLEEQALRGSDVGTLVRGAAFARVKWREGYDVGEVDGFLARMAAAVVTAPEPLPAGPTDGEPRSGSAWAIRSLVGRARFRPVRLHEGYDMATVDEFLDRVVEAAERDEPIAPLVDGARLTRVRLREGYDITEVDAFLQQLKGAPVAVADPGVVKEQRGLLDRLRGRD